MKRQRALFLGDAHSQKNHSQVINHLKRLAVFMTGKYSSKEGYPILSCKAHYVTDIETEGVEPTQSDQTVAKVVTSIAMYTDGDYNFKMGKGAAYFTINRTRDVLVLQNFDGVYEMSQPQRGSRIYKEVVDKMFFGVFTKIDMNTFGKAKTTIEDKIEDIREILLNSVSEAMIMSDTTLFIPQETKDGIIASTDDSYTELAKGLLDKAGVAKAKESIKLFLENLPKNGDVFSTDGSRDHLSKAFSEINLLLDSIPDTVSHDNTDTENIPEDAVSEALNTEKTLS